MACSQRLSAAWMAGILLLAIPAVATAQTPTPGTESKVAKPKASTKAKTAGKAETATGPGAVGRQSMLGLVKSANIMVWPLVLCSVVAVGFALERLVALRRGRVAPAEFVERFLDRLSGGKLDKDRATELCRAHDSPMARIFAVIVANWGQPATVIRQAVSLDAAGEVADLKRNVRVLNATATLAPLLGLLGTVIGMIEAFDALSGPAASGLSKGERLAHGISLALMATAAGLGIAIVSVAAYYFLLHRVDALLKELEDQARRAIEIVAGETLPISRPMGDRRPLVASDPRPEPRTLGRSEPL